MKAIHYIALLERLRDDAEELILTSHRHNGMTTVNEDLIHTLSRDVIDSRRLRARLDDRLSRPDHEGDTETFG